MKKRFLLFVTVALPIVALPQTARKPSTRSEAQQQTDKGPSLADTNAWIADKLLHFAGYSFTANRRNAQDEPVTDEKNQRITDVSLHDGNWHFTEVRTVNTTIRKKDGSLFHDLQIHTTLVTFKAQDLSPDVSVSTANGCFGKIKDGMETTGDTNCFTVTLTSAGKGASVSVEEHATSRFRRDEEAEQSEPEEVSRTVEYGADIRFNNADMANRVAKAMSHAIQLARSEHPEPF